MFAFRVSILTLNSEGELVVMKRKMSNDITMHDTGDPYPSSMEEFDTAKEAVIGARKHIIPTLINGMGSEAYGMSIHIEDLVDNACVNTFTVLRGSLVCPRCAAIDPLDGPVISPGVQVRGEERIPTWLHDRRTGKLAYAVVYGVTTVVCKVCGTESPVEAVQTNISAVLGKEASIRYMGLERKVVRDAR